MITFDALTALLALALQNVPDRKVVLNEESKAHLEALTAKGERLMLGYDNGEVIATFVDHEAMAVLIDQLTPDLVHMSRDPESGNALYIAHKPHDDAEQASHG